MKKPHPKTGRCPECKRICRGNTSYPNTWYCDNCKIYFGEMKDNMPIIFVRPGEC